MEGMDKKTKLVVGLLASFGGGLVIFLMGLGYDFFPYNAYSNVFWMIFIVLIVYFALGAELIKIPGMIVTYICGLVWGFISNVTAYLFIRNHHILFAFLNYFLIASLIVFVHQFLAEGTVFGVCPCAFLGLAFSIFAATCSIPDRTGTFMAANTWNFIDLFIIFMIGIVMVALLSLFTGFLIKNYMKIKMKKMEDNQEGNQ